MGASCRRLKLESSTEFTCLAPDNLLHLPIDWDIQTASYPSEFPDIGRLRQLTVLKLPCSCPISAHLLQGLPLRELTLLDCSPSTFSQLCDLFVPGALTALQKLRIEEVADSELEADGNASKNWSPQVATQTQMAQKDEARIRMRRPKAEAHMSVLQKLGAAVQRLPQLEQVSGDSALFDIVLSQYLKPWHVYYGKYTRFGEDLWLKVWSRV